MCVFVVHFNDVSNRIQSPPSFNSIINIRRPPLCVCVCHPANQRSSSSSPTNHYFTSAKNPYALSLSFPRIGFLSFENHHLIVVLRYFGLSNVCVFYLRKCDSPARRKLINNWLFTLGLPLFHSCAFERVSILLLFHARITALANSTQPLDNVSPLVLEVLERRIQKKLTERTSEQQNRDNNIVFCEHARTHAFFGEKIPLAFPIFFLSICKQ